jgi:hypothetical protein
VRGSGFLGRNRELTPAFFASHSGTETQGSSLVTRLCRMSSGADFGTKICFVLAELVLSGKNV